MGGSPGRLCQPVCRRGGEVRSQADQGGRHGLFRHDARLPAPGRKRGAALPLPHLAQHHDRPGGGGADRPLRLQHPPAVVHRPPVPGHPQRGGAREGHRLPHHPGGVRPLQAHRCEGPGRGRGQRHVPHRQRLLRLRPGHGGLLRRPGGGQGLPLEAAGHPAQGAPRRGGRGLPHPRGGQAPGPRRGPGARLPGGPSRGGRGHRHGGHQRGGPPHRQRVRRHLGVCHDRAGEGPQQGLSGDRHGDHPHRQAGGHGPLQQLHQRDQRLGQGFQGLPGGPGPEARYERGVHRHV